MTKNCSQFSVDYQFINQDNDYNQPAVGIRISYHFNSTASKYKGTGAGQAVKDRM